MKIGFTGTRRGCTPAQYERLRVGLAVMMNHARGNIELHHGDCRGADEEAHELARALCFPYIEIHPPINPIVRAFCEGNKVNDPIPYVQRNQAIVKVADVLVACPQGNSITRIGGTSWTVKHARKMGKAIVIVWPNGGVTKEPAM